MGGSVHNLGAIKATSSHQRIDGVACGALDRKLAADQSQELRIALRCSKRSGRSRHSRRAAGAVRHGTRCRVHAACTPSAVTRSGRCPPSVVPSRPPAHLHLLCHRRHPCRQPRVALEKGSPGGGVSCVQHAAIGQHHPQLPQRMVRVLQGCGVWGVGVQGKGEAIRGCTLEVTGGLLGVRKGKTTLHLEGKRQREERGEEGILP